MGFFRQEVIEAQRRKLEGDVTLHQPVSFPLMTACMGLLTLLLLGYLLVGSFPRRETVNGVVVPDRGVVAILSPNTGVVDRLPIHVGDNIRAGAPVATIMVGPSNTMGQLAEQQRREILNRIKETDLEIEQNADGNEQDQIRLKAKAASIAAELSELKSQVPIRLNQLTIAQQEVQKVDPLVKRGFISQAERDSLTQAVLTQEDLIEQLKVQIAEKNADYVDVVQQIKALPFNRDAEASQLAISKSTLTQSLAELATQERIVVRSPLDGTILGLQSHTGDGVTTGKIIATIFPKGGVLHAEIVVPTKAAGFIATGQNVRLMVDAFPFDKFGFLPAKIEQISWSPTAMSNANGASDSGETGYKVDLALDRSTFYAYGRNIPLQPGMTLKADILTDRRTLVDWALNPILAARKRAQ